MVLHQSLNISGDPGIGNNPKNLSAWTNFVLNIILYFDGIGKALQGLYRKKH